MQAGKWLRLVRAVGGPIQPLSVDHEVGAYWMQAFALSPSSAAHMAQVPFPLVQSRPSSWHGPCCASQVCESSASALITAESVQPRELLLDLLLQIILCLLAGLRA